MMILQSLSGGLVRVNSSAICATGYDGSTLTVQWVQWTNKPPWPPPLLPSMSVLDKILRYQTPLVRQMFRAMNQLERLQRMRHEESTPALLTMEVTERP